MAWILNHHFFGGRHFVWAATPFHPYRLLNPRSSNPYLMYADFYMPWKDNDEYDRFIGSMRLSLIKGIIAMTPELGDDLAGELEDVCTRGPVELFFPIVYRLDLRHFDPARLDIKNGSARLGSEEVLVRDLAEWEFDIRFSEEHDSGLLRHALSPSREAMDVLNRLKSACA